MLMLDMPVLRQRLFTACAPDGQKLYLGFLLDGSCAIVGERGEAIEFFGADEDSLERAIERFLAITKPMS